MALHALLALSFYLTLLVGASAQACDSPSNAMKFLGDSAVPGGNLPNGCPALSSASDCACATGNYLVGKYAVKQPVPDHYPTGYAPGKVFFTGAVVNRAKCCASCAALNMNSAGTGFESLRCAYWQHIVGAGTQASCSASGSGSSKCGFCIIYPQSKAPKCETKRCTDPSWANAGEILSNYSSVGKACAPAGPPPPPHEIIDDPHFVGAHGTRYDFNGELDKNYCLVSDKGFHINALLDGYRTDIAAGATVGVDGKATRSWMRELGFVWADAVGQQHSLHLVARRGKDVSTPGLLTSIEYDGVKVAVPSTPNFALMAGGVTVEFLGLSQRDNRVAEQWRVAVAAKAKILLEVMPAVPSFRQLEDAENHFNMIFEELETSANVHGLIGQTYRNTPAQLLKSLRYSAVSKLIRQPIVADGSSGLGFLDGTPSDYESSNILSPDCKMSSFL